MKIKLSKSQWEFVGKKAGWMRAGQVNEGKMSLETKYVLNKDELVKTYEQMEMLANHKLTRDAISIGFYENELTKILGCRPFTGLQISQEQADKIEELQSYIEIQLDPTFDVEETMVFQKKPDGTIVLVPGSNSVGSY